MGNLHKYITTNIFKKNYFGFRSVFSLLPVLAEVTYAEEQNKHMWDLRGENWETLRNFTDTPRRKQLPGMNEHGHYPPPDFGIPQPNSFQQLPRSSSFQPGMWSWNETPTESSTWGEQAGWHPGASGHAHGRPHRPYGAFHIQETDYMRMLLVLSFAFRKRSSSAMQLKTAS